MTERLAGGELLYRDVRLQYGPVSPYLLVAWGRIFGLSSASILVANWIPGVALGLLLLRAAKPYLELFERAALAVLLLGICLGPGRAHLVLPYSPAAVHALCFSVGALLLVRSEENERWRPLLAGAFVGLAFCCKQEIGLAAAAGIATLAATRTAALRRWAALFVAGSAPVVAAAALFAARMAPLEVLRYENHLWPVGTVPEEWKFLANLAMGLTSDWPVRIFFALLALAGACVLAGLAGLLRAGDPRLRSPRGAVLTALGVGALAAAPLSGHRWDPLCLSMLAAFAVAIWALREPSLHGRPFLVAFGVFAGLVATRAAFAGQTLWSSYTGIAYAATAVTWGILLSWVPGLFPGGQASRVARQVLAGALLLLACVLTWNGVAGLRRPDAVAFATGRGVVWLDRPLVDFYELLRRELRPAERVLVLPEANALEPLFGVRAASPFPVLLPGWLDSRAEARILAESKLRAPDAVVIFQRPTPEFGVGPLGDDYGVELIHWVVENYRIAGSTPYGLLFRPRQTGAASKAAGATP